MFGSCEHRRDDSELWTTKMVRTMDMLKENIRVTE